MTLSRISRAAAVLALAGWGVLIPVGVAGADCTTAGDFGAGAGCPPGSSGSNKTESWPPTAVDWPPQLSDDNINEGGGKSGSSGGAQGGDKTTPIVMPSGQRPPVTSSSGSDSTSTSTSETPIVPVGPATAGKTSTSSVTTSTSATPIVTPGG